MARDYDYGHMTQGALENLLDHYESFNKTKPTRAYQQKIREIKAELKKRDPRWTR